MARGLGMFVDVGRDEARRLAEQELADPIYQDDPQIVQRIIEWVLRQLDELFVRGVSLGGPGALLLLIPIAVIVALVLWRFGPLARRAARSDQPVFGTQKRTAAQYRRAADTAHDRQDWTTSVLERFRAIVAGLEERAVLNVKAGRTADEASREAGRFLPSLSGRLDAAALTFDDVRYGERTATAAEAEQLRELERDVRGARPAHDAVPTPSGPAVPV